VAETREKTVLEIGYEEASLDRLKAQLKELAQLDRPLGNLTGGGEGEAAAVVARVADLAAAESPESVEAVAASRPSWLACSRERLPGTPRT